MSHLRPVYMFVCLHVSMITCLPSFLFSSSFTYVYMFICLQVYMFICLHVYISTCLYDYMSTFLSFLLLFYICPHVYMSTSLYVVMSTCLYEWSNSIFCRFQDRWPISLENIVFLFLRCDPWPLILVYSIKPQSRVHCLSVCPM